MEITVTQILIGIVITLFAAWVIWVSDSAVENRNSITALKESDKAVIHDLSQITDQITTMGDKLTSEFKEFKIEVRGDITQMSNVLNLFTKTETDVLKEILKERK
jgi:hypothetical protein